MDTGAVLTAIDPVPLRVEVAGCKGGEKAAQTCALREPDGAGEPALLQVWVDGDAHVDIAVDADVVTPRESEQIDGGWHYVVPIARGATALTIRRAGAVPWRLQLLPAPVYPVLGPIRATLPDQNDATRGPRLEVVLGKIEAALPLMGTAEQAEALWVASVMTWDLGRDGAEFGRRALAAAIEAGDATVVVYNAGILLHMLGPDSDEAGWVLELASLYAGNVVDGRNLVQLEMNLASEALRAGEGWRGIELLRAAEARARRLGLRDVEGAAGARVIAELALRGREAERVVALERFYSRSRPSSSETACVDAANLTNIGSSFVQARFLGASTADPEPTVAAAVARFDTDAVRCEVGDNREWQDGRALAHGLSVQSALLGGHWADAKRRLEWFDGHAVDASRVTDLVLSHVELALGQDDLEVAANHLREVHDTDDLEEWRHQLLRARVAERRGQRAAALRAYLAAERVVDALTAGAGIQPPRDDTSLGIHAGAAGAIALLVREGRKDEAARVARRSRGRTLRPVGRAAQLTALSARERSEWRAAVAEYETARDRIAAELTDAWAMPADARAFLLRSHGPLRAAMQAAHGRAFDILSRADTSAPPSDGSGPRPGDLWLYFHPAGRGWFGIAQSPSATVVLAIDALGTTPEALGHALLDPFDAEIAAAREVRVLAMGPLLDVAFHELPWREHALIDHVPVTWAVDFGLDADPSPGTGALVVADPATHMVGIGRLPHARHEAVVVADALVALGMPVKTLLGADATLLEVLAQLGEVRWFHYAGHGLVDGRSAWDAALPLAGEAVLTVRDIITTAPVPETVVLSGCETAASGVGGLGLATAFVLAGSRNVVGSATVLRDNDARDMSESLYRHSGIADGPAWFRAAVLDGRARDQAWTASIRLWQP